MKKIVVLVIVFVGLLLTPMWAGQDLFIKNGTILTITKGVIHGGDILIIGGKIKQIGHNLTPPEGIPIIDATGLYVMPGIIDSHSHIALSGTNEGSVAISSEVRMKDVINAEDTSIYTALTGGVTMVHTMHGSANPIGGESVVLKLKWGKTAEEMYVPYAYRTLKFALGENPKQANIMVASANPRYPQTRMGVMAIIRREFEKARTYMEEWNRYNQLKKNKKLVSFILPPRRNLRLEPLVLMLQGKMVVRCHTYQADETLEFIKLSKEFGFKIAAFEHAWEAYKIAKELAAEKIGISVFADSWAYKMEAYQGIAYMAAFCAKNGVLVSINSDSGERIRRLFNDAAKTMRYGDLPEEEALKLITINPAIQLGVEKRVGSLEVGKDADIAIFKEHPLSAFTRCEKTIIEGEIYFDRAKYLEEQKKREEEQKKKEKAGKKTPKGGQK